ncbi:hypothetical protein [Peribacillus asahii]|uniref:hypothetical protein n=1 Tax=Peribacillus asahii TaxID=228899 RepID=UPI0037FC57C7
MKRKKYRLRPWVQVSILFVLGIVVVSKVFSMIDALANDMPENQIYHGIITLNINGESHLSILEDDFDRDKEIYVDRRKGYDPCEIITVVLQGDKIVKHYKTEGKELSGIEYKHSIDIAIIRENVIESIYE